MLLTSRDEREHLAQAATWNAPMRLIWLTILIPMGLTQGASAQSAGPFEKVAVAGKVQRLGYINSINADCSPAAIPSVSILQPPRQGRVTFRRGLDYSSYPANNVRSRCNTRKINSMVTFYEPSINAYGDDLFAVEYVDLYGTPRRFQYHVSIRPRS